MEKATFAAGCFWGTEQTFRTAPGVLEATSGYIGGEVKNPTYEQVCSGRTGHAEAVEVEFDPEEVSYDSLLNIFWENHNPTTLNRQGPDSGEQYRSGVFYHSPEQREIALASREALELSGKWDDPIVTSIEEAGQFWPAEEYHQRFLEKRGQASCHI